MARKHKPYETKWNTKKVNELLKEVIQWHYENPTKLTYFQFLCDNRDKYKFGRINISYICNKWGDAETEELEKEIKQIQEEKLVANSLDNEWAPQMARFVLNCNYGYIPKQQQEVKVQDRSIQFDFGNTNNDIIPDEE